MKRINPSIIQLVPIPPWTKVYAKYEGVDEHGNKDSGEIYYSRLGYIALYSDGITAYVDIDEDGLVEEPNIACNFLGLYFIRNENWLSEKEFKTINKLKEGDH